MRLCLCLNVIHLVSLQERGGVVDSNPASSPCFCTTRHVNGCNGAGSLSFLSAERRQSVGKETKSLHLLPPPQVVRQMRHPAAFTSAEKGALGSCKKKRQREVECLSSKSESEGRWRIFSVSTLFAPTVEEVVNEPKRKSSSAC